MLAAGHAAVRLEAILTTVNISWQTTDQANSKARLSIHPGELEPKNMLVKEALRSTVKRT